MYYFIGINILQDGHVKRFQCIGKVLHKISPILVTLIFVFYLITNILIITRVENALSYVFILQLFNNASTFYFYYVQKNSSAKLRDVSECLDVFGFYLPSTKHFNEFKKKCDKIIRNVMIYYFLTILMEPCYILYIGYSKDDMAVIYWLNDAKGHQKVIYYIFGYLLISLKGIILKRSICLFITNYALTCFLIKQACRLQWRMVKLKSSFTMELLYQKLTETIQEIDKKLNFLAFLSFAILFTQTFASVYEIFFGTNNSSELGFVVMEFFNGTIGFLVLTFSGSRVYEECQNIQEKAMMLDPDVYIEHPETMLKFERFELRMTLWNLISIQKSLIGTIFEILITYVVIIGTVQNV
ncbi:uncharacterized protein TNCV_4859241 [Trichonephila clavipes]|nr:uncharacterized protein TNCV_4859241 [Trichonephila clavipes]